MSDKQVVMEVIQNMPESISLEEIQEVPCVSSVIQVLFIRIWKPAQKLATEPCRTIDRCAADISHEPSRTVLQFATVQLKRVTDARQPESTDHGLPALFLGPVCGPWHRPIVQCPVDGVQHQSKVVTAGRSRRGLTRMQAPCCQFARDKRHIADEAGAHCPGKVTG